MHPTLQTLLKAALIVCAASQAVAAPVTWTLNNVSFWDGGSASGYFVVDTTSPGFVYDYHITTTAGNFYAGQEYPPAFPSTGDQRGEVTSQGFFASIFVYDFSFRFDLLIDADVLHTTRGTYQVLTGCEVDLSPCSVETASFFADGIRRSVSAGTVTATMIPEVSSFVYVAVGAALLVLVRLRRRS